MKFVGETMCFQLSIVRFLLLIVASLIVVEPVGQCIRHGRSGLYYDNGEDQTVIHEITSRRERRALAWNILKLLDLPIKSSRSKAITMNVPASRFIREVYKTALGKQEAGSFKFTDSELKTIEDSDIILSYSALPRLEHQSKNTLRFDVSETPELSNAFRSELRVYVKPLVNSTWRMSVFDSQDFVDSTKVISEGWIKLNTGKVLRRWLNCSDCNRELYLSAVSLDNDIGDSLILTFDEPQRRAFLVGYFVNLQRTSAQLTVPNFRFERSTKVKAPRNYLDNPYSEVKESYRRRKTSCAIHSLHVSFRELDFDKYIVEPEGYDARYCHGDCRFPLTANLNATNHALVQTLVHFIRPRLAPRVSCAPREYEHLPVFYSQNGNDFVYKIYRQMIVKNCGCS